MENIKKLMDTKIWVTKKTRMESEKNLVMRNTILNYTLIYYSGCLAVMSYLTLATKGSFDLTIVAGVISVVLPSVNIFQYKADYSRRSSKYKECYLKLEDLESKCKTIISTYEEKKSDIDEIAKIEKTIYEQYNEILSMCENHSDYDYYIFRKKQVENGNSNFSINKKEKRMYNIIKFFVILSMVIIFVTPLFFLCMKIFS